MCRSVHGHRELPTDYHHKSPGSATRCPNPRQPSVAGQSRDSASSPSHLSPEAARGWDAAAEVLSDTARSPTDPAHRIALAPGTELLAGTELVAGTELGAVSEAAIYLRSLPSEPARRPPLRDGGATGGGRPRTGGPSLAPFSAPESGYSSLLSGQGRETPSRAKMIRCTWVSRSRTSPAGV